MKTNWSQSLCNQKEVGNRLALLFLNLFDPITNIDKSVLKTPVDNYKESVARLVRLPENMKYFHFDIPKLPTYVEDGKGRDLVIQHDYEYTRIKVDPQGYISSFSYIGKREIPLLNLSCLYGKHEKYLNQLISRFDEGIIKDIFSYLIFYSRYFEEDWALCIFHDRFLEFLSDLRNDGEMKKEGELKQLVEALAAETEKVTSCLMVAIAGRGRCILSKF